jgi:hypothetical protein
MRKCLVAIAVLAVLCGLLVSCFPVLATGVTEYHGDDKVKPPVVLQLMTANNTDASINVRIRHRYKKGWLSAEGEISNSDWTEYAIPAGGSAVLGDETVAFVEGGAETEWSGFILLDKELNHYFSARGGHSSFELEATVEDRALRLAGYESEDPSFSETRLSDLRLQVYPYGPIWRSLWVFYKPIEMMIGFTGPTLLTASLRFNADGTYSFDLDPPWDPGID